MVAEELRNNFHTCKAVIWHHSVTGTLCITVIHKFNNLYEEAINYELKKENEHMP